MKDRALDQFLADFGAINGRFRPFLSEGFTYEHHA